MVDTSNDELDRNFVFPARDITSELPINKSARPQSAGKGKVIKHHRKVAIASMDPKDIPTIEHRASAAVHVIGDKLNNLGDRIEVFNYQVELLSRDSKALSAEMQELFEHFKSLDLISEDQLEQRNDDMQPRALSIRQQGRNFIIINANEASQIEVVLDKSLKSRPQLTHMLHVDPENPHSTGIKLNIERRPLPSLDPFTGNLFNTGETLLRSSRYAEKATRSHQSLLTQAVTHEHEAALAAQKDEIKRFVKTLVAGNPLPSGMSIEMILDEVRSTFGAAIKAQSLEK